MVAGIRPKVAIDARLVSGSNTGDSVYWEGLLSGFAQIDLEFELLLYSNKPRPPEVPEQFQWIHLPGKNERWWSLVQFPLAARRAGALLIHTQYNLSPLAHKGIVTIHDVSFFIGPQWFKSRDLFLLSRFIPRSAKAAEKIITVSETSKKEIEQFIPAAFGKVHVTPNAASPKIQPIERTKAQAIVRDKLGIEEPFLLTVGTRWPRKNMQLAIDAASKLAPHMPHKLLVTGKPGWGEENLNPRVVATGYVDWELLSALYSAADLYLAPSRHEGFGIPLLEAFNCGCPVLCSSGGALPEVAGEAAYIETSWEAQAWAQTIERLLGDSSKLEEMRTKGLERAKLFSWKRTAELTQAVYLEALS